MAAAKSSSPCIAQILAHPIRWAILRELARSDRRVHELTARVGAAQNLVSYHLALLRRSGVVGEQRSSADRRDVYYRLDLAAVRAKLEELGIGLHPALGHPGPPLNSARGAVLFLCTGNSARSQMAEALVRRITRGRVVAASAGTRPEGVHPLAVKTLQGMGVATRGLHSKHWSDLDTSSFNHVVSLCDIAREELPPEVLGQRHVHWSVADPAAVNGPAAKREAAFATAAHMIEGRIPALLASMPASAA
jgi:protein-tyrosine-phosphatase/DNA-binding transcriptional ArsR family regulator